MKVVEKITSLFLAVIFLLSSLGLTISSMICSKSGKEKVALVIIEDCCAKKKDITQVKTDCCDNEESSLTLTGTSVKKADCCDISNITVSLNDFQNAQKIAVEQMAVIQSLFYNYSEVNAKKLITSNTSNLPPSLSSGRQLLSLISILTI